MKEAMKPETGNPLAAMPISRLLMQFAIPSVLSMLMDALYNAVDQIFIARGAGLAGRVLFPTQNRQSIKAMLLWHDRKKQTERGGNE